MNWLCRLFRVLVIIIFVVSFKITNAQYFEDDQISCSPDNVNYEWERLNYYEILGLSSSTAADNLVDSKAIRKAYRREAQRWHPDKIKANATLPLEEINARFTRIASAYETLNNPSKRQAYDRFLKNCNYIHHDTRGRDRSPTQSDRASKGYEPRQQSDYYNNPSYSNSNPYDNPYHYYNQQQHQKQQHYGYNSGDSFDHHNSHHRGDDAGSYSSSFKNNTHTPSSVRKERTMLVDPMTGVPILRETTFEEYQQENHYRILVMDYLVQSMDSWGNTYYQPLYPTHMILEEGQLQEPPTNTLTQGDVLRTGQILLSSNEWYRARVHHCQLVVETLTKTNNDSPHTKMDQPSGFDDDDELTIRVIWKSDKFVRSTTDEVECFLALEDGLLLVAGGSPEVHTGHIFWHSTIHSGDDGDEQQSYTNNRFGNQHDFIARMENDGKLVVYRIRSVPPFVSGDDSEARCVYATGHLGCIRIASKMLHIWRVGRDQLLREVLDRITAFADQHTNSDETFGGGFYGNDDDDDDDDDDEDFYFSRTLLREAKRALNGLNRARKQAEASLEQRTLQFVHDIHMKWQERRSR